MTAAASDAWPAWCRYDAGSRTLTVEVHVQPGAARTECCGTHGDRLKVRLAARPIAGEANRALVAWFSETLGAAQRDVSIVRGATSRAKTVRVHEAGPDTAACTAALGAP